MSILIPGVEMPTSCSRCPMLEGDRLDGLCHAASRWLDDDEYWTWYVYPEGDMDDSKPCNCPLVPVPEHGRLIDADADVYNYITTWRCNCSDFGSQTVMAVDDLQYLPTIIPAEEVDNG